MIEGWTALEVVSCVFVVGYIVTIFTGVIAPVVYAWADRWLDRTRNSIVDKVSSEDK